MLLLWLALGCGGTVADTADPFTTTTTWSGTTTGPSCGGILAEHRLAFDGLVENNRACTELTDCQIVHGSCEMGLGETTAVNLDVAQADFDGILDAYEAEATAAGCPTQTRTCDSTASWSAVCEGGFCSAVSTY